MVKLKRRYKFLVGIVVMVAVFAGIAHKLASPAEGQQVSVDQQLVKPHSTVVKTVATPAQNVNAKYFQLALPQGYTAQPNNTPPAGLLYSLTLLKPGADGTLIISIGLKPLPDGGLSGDSSYSFYQSKPQQYEMTAQAVGTDSVKIANDTQNAAVVGFWQHAGYLATIGVSSGGGGAPSENNADLLNALRAVLGAWQWQG